VLIRRRQADAARAPQLRLVDSAFSAPNADLSRRAFVQLLAGAVALGVIVRLSFVLAAGFPIGDGGLFYQMARDLQHAGYALPATTSYNGAHIPYAYPPLMLYAAALVDRFTPLTLFDALRWLPLVGSGLTIAAFAALARDMLSSRTAAAFAVFCFAMLPRSFAWLLMGGGLTRGFGLAFAILAIHAAYLLYTRREWRFAACLTLFASAALLAHIEMAWFAAFSCAILFAAYGRHRAGAVGSLLACFGVAALTAPWWLTIVARNGVDPFVSAFGARDASTANPILLLITFRFTNELLFPVSAALGLLGAITCVAARRYVLPTWMVAIALLDARALGTVASVPLALLAGIAFTDVVLPLIARASERLHSLPDDRTDDSGRPIAGSILPVAAVACLAVYMVLMALVSTPQQLTAASFDERAAMQWPADHTPTGSRFLIVTGDQWASDRTSEWFPALSGRVSAATAQGYEWAPGGAFNRRLTGYRTLQKCSDADSLCIAEWSRERGVEFDYVYLPKLSPRTDATANDPHECCAALRASLRADPSYATVFDGPGATIFKLRS
jgi:hypothetical protein